MKIIEKILYIEFADLLKCGWNENTVKSANLRNGPFWQMIRNPADKRMPLVQFDTLRDKDKKKIEAQFGNPYDYMAKEPIKKLVTTDFKAESFYTNHKYGIEQKGLLPEHIAAYTTAASWLNMINKLNADKKFIKTELKLTITEFFDNVCAIIAAEGINLPATYRRLKDSMKEYKEAGYVTLISGRFANVNSAKIKDELSESVLLEMIANHNQHDDVWVSIHYNTWAKQNGKLEITDRTVCNYRNNNADIIDMQRKGREAYYNEWSKNIKRYRPTNPLYLVESDDNHLDFFFTDWEDKTSHRHFHKFKAIVVTDSYNDYVLGYAYARELTTEVVIQAYQNAFAHVKEITGNYMLPQETKTDRWAIGTLEPFYKKLGNYFKTPVGSKRRGYLEQFFGSTHWKRCIKHGTNNYTGNNLTAINEGVNKEVLFANKKDYPTVQEAPQHIEDFFYRLRNMPNKDGVTKKQEWLKAYADAAQDKFKIVSEEEYLLKLGTVKPRTNTITSNGLDIQIDGKQYNYDIPNQYYFAHKGCELNTIYDPNDMSRVLVTDFESIRFIARAPYLQPSNLADYKEGDRTRLNAHLNAKLDHVKLVTDKQERRHQLLKENSVDIQALLSSPYLLKEERQLAEIEYGMEKEKALPTRRVNPIDKM